MTIPPEKRTNAIQSRSSGVVPASVGERLRTLVEGIVVAAVALGVYVYAVYPVSVAITPLRPDSPVNLLVLVVTVLFLNLVYDLLGRLVR